MAYRTLNPFTEERIKDYPEHTDAEVEAALATADALFRSDWSRGDIAPRLKVLSRMSELLTERSGELVGPGPLGERASRASRRRDPAAERLRLRRGIAGGRGRGVRARPRPGGRPALRRPRLRR